MHMPPLQYIKAMKLHRAKILLSEGNRVNETGYLVGYNSPSQFSREFKRYFGYVPSETTVLITG
jgi:AraC-like DNA-binding protein